MQKEYFGTESARALKSILESIKPKNIFLFVGKKSYEDCGAKDEFNRVLAPYEVTFYSDFDSNPRLEDIKKGLKVYRAKKNDLCIAVGGGSVLDIAKSINILSVQEGLPEDFILGKEKIIKKGLPVIAVPTTSGTGAESTHFSVVYVDKKKYSLAHPYILPDFSIIDPRFTFNSPKSISAQTGIDALSQSIESYWSILSTEESKSYAKESINLIIQNFLKAVLENKHESKIAMSRGAHLSGKAINISRTTASHAMSYPLTAHFGIPHGHAVGLTLPSLLIYNAHVTEEDVVDSRGVEYVRKTLGEIVTYLGAKSPEEAAKIFENLLIQVGLKSHLRDLMITRVDVEKILRDLSNERMENNPRKFKKEDAKKIFELIL